ncbi:Uncharacterised protein [Mycobacteroides abscessus subsp. abscessus]|nr:Uncharacterised protein [Mycobacteroides abscessus subsp. abscessus]
MISVFMIAFSGLPSSLLSASSWKMEGAASRISLSEMMPTNRRSESMIGRWRIFLSFISLRASAIEWSGESAATSTFIMSSTIMEIFPLN